MTARPVRIHDMPQWRQETWVVPRGQRGLERIQLRDRWSTRHHRTDRGKILPGSTLHRRGRRCRTTGPGGGTRRWRTGIRTTPPPPSGHRSAPSFYALIDFCDLAGKALALAMLQIEQIVERPMEVISDVRDLFVKAFGRVRRYSPRRPPATSTANSCSQFGQVTAARVCPSWLIRR